jgi:hypothetical protein
MSEEEARKRASARKGAENMTDSIDEGFDKLLKDFDELLLGKSLSKSTEAKNNIDRLIDFGFTLKEAKNWLKKEPNYRSSDENLQREKSDEDLIEPSRKKLKKFRETFKE